MLHQPISQIMRTAIVYTGNGPSMAEHWLDFFSLPSDPSSVAALVDYVRDPNGPEHEHTFAPFKEAPDAR